MEVALNIGEDVETVPIALDFGEKSLVGMDAGTSRVIVVSLYEDVASDFGVVVIIVPRLLNFMRGDEGLVDVDSVLGMEIFFTVVSGEYLVTGSDAKEAV